MIYLSRRTFYIKLKRHGCMKETWMPPALSANLVANSGNTIYGASVIGSVGTNFSEILIKIQQFSFTKMHLKISSAKVSAILSRGRLVNVMFSVYSPVTLPVKQHPSRGTPSKPSTSTQPPRAFFPRSWTTWRIRWRLRKWLIMMSLQCWYVWWYTVKPLL